MFKDSKIVICGNIGAGKTTLCKGLENYLISKNLSVTYIDEKFEDNKYLEPFYNEMKINPGYNKYFYPMESFFIETKFISDSKIYPTDFVIFDRSLYDVLYIFIKAGFKNNLCTFDEEKSLSIKSLEYIKSIKYDIFIYLRTQPDTLVERIKLRNRKMESDIDINYIKQLNDLYDDLFFSEILSNKIIIDTDNLDINKTLESVIHHIF